MGSETGKPEEATLGEYRQQQHFSECSGIFLPFLTHCSLAVCHQRTV